MSPRNWPDLPHGCKLSQLETAMQLIQRSIRWTDPMTETKSQWVSPAAPLASPLKLFSTGFLEHFCFYKSSSQTGTCKPSPKGCDFTDVHISIHVIPASDLMGSGRRKEVELGEDLDKSKPQPWALLSAVLSLFPWACCGCCTALCSCLSWHSLHPLRRHKDWGLSVLCNLKPHKGQVFVDFCVYLHFLNHCKSAILL